LFNGIEQMQANPDHASVVGRSDLDLHIVLDEGLAGQRHAPQLAEYVTAQRIIGLVLRQTDLQLVVEVFEADARVRVEDVNDELEIRLPEDESYDTLGGYVFSKLGRVPVAGESFVEDNVKIEVLQADDRRVIRVRLHLQDAIQQE
jgi:hypothetical protein